MEKFSLSTIILFKICKYLFVSFFVAMLIAAILGRDGIQKYHVGEPNSIKEEYLIIMGLFIAYDAIKYLIGFLSKKP